MQPGSSAFFSVRCSFELLLDRAQSTRVHYTAGMLRDHACTLCAAPSFSLLLLFACFSCTFARPCTIDLYTILHATLHCACAILRGHARPSALPPVSEVSQFRLSGFFFRGHDLENNLTLHTFVFATCDSHNNTILTL